MCDIFATNTALVCDLSACGGDANITAIPTYDSSNREYTVFGDCNGTNFCCGVEDGTASITEAYVIGGDYNDAIDLKLSDATGDYDLGPPIEFAQVTAGDGSDTIEGSRSTATTYLEKLFGESHADTISGNKGDDIIVCGQGNDDASGNMGDDCIWGDRGFDELLGGYGDDVLFDECQSGGGQNYMQGGPHDDKLWYQDDASCVSGAELDSTSSCDSGSPTGTNDWFGQTSAIQSKPGDCENTLTGKPTCSLGDSSIVTPPAD